MQNIEIIRFSFVLFPSIAFLLTIPVVVMQYHKYGWYNVKSAFDYYAFFFFLQTAFLLVCLPLPSQQSVAEAAYTWRDKVQLIPFHFLADFAGLFRTQGIHVSTLTSFTILQVLFNVLLILPLGIFSRNLLGLSRKQNLIFAFCLSLFFELSQLTGLFFLYPKPYRIFDVDDLLSNTFGAVLGYFIAPLFSCLFPNPQKAAQKTQQKNQNPGVAAQVWSVFLDSFILTNISVVVFLVVEFLLAEKYSAFFQTVPSAILYAAIALAYYVVPSLKKCDNYQTLGLKLMNFQLTSETAPLRRVRFIVSQFFYMLPSFVIYIYNPGFTPRDLLLLLFFVWSPFFIQALFRRTQNPLNRLLGITFRRKVFHAVPKQTATSYIQP